MTVELTIVAVLGLLAIACGFLGAFLRPLKQYRWLLLLFAVLAALVAIVVGVAAWVLRGNEKPPQVIVDIGASMFNPRGKGNQPSSEYACIQNQSGEQINLLLWRLTNRRREAFVFPDFPLFPGKAGRVRLNTGRGRSSNTDLYWNRDTEAWDDHGDIVTILSPQGVEVFTADYPERPEGDATIECAPQKTQSVGIVVADFQTELPSEVLRSGTATSVAKIFRDPTTCTLFDCIQVDYSSIGAKGRPVGFSLVFRGASNLAARDFLCIEARGQSGGERFDLAVRDVEGRSDQIPVRPLTSEWRTIAIPVRRFESVDLEVISDVSLFFKGADPEGTAFFQRIFATSEGACEDVSVLVKGEALVQK